jgi:lipoprotein-anchoring transpeptidase ErfK/SrfK
MKQRGITATRRHLTSASALGAAVIALLVLPAPPSAHAQDGWLFGNPSPSQRRVIRTPQQRLDKRSRATEDAEQRQKSKGAAVAETKPTGPLFAILSLSDQHISVYNGSGLVTRSRVSTGMPGHRTPLGIYTIIGRERYHRSNIYSGAPMPFMQRITWSGIAMHLGVVPGYPASHGCIRLPSGSAERMWGLTRIGERLMIAPHEVAPSEFAHPLLPVPKLQMSPLATAENAAPKRTEVAAAGNDPIPLGSSKPLNPSEYAQALKARASSDIAEAAKALQVEAQRKEPLPEAIRKALSDLRAAESARSQADAKLAVRTEALATKRDAREMQRAQAARAAAEASRDDAVKRLQATFESPAFATPEGREALEAERKLMAVRASLAKAQATAKDAERRLSPISILVSKKDNKIYVRQALAPIFEGPVSIRDRDAPLGTHVYIATSHADNSSLGWTVVSYPTTGKTADETGSRRGRSAGAQVKAGAEEARPDAGQALARIEFPTEVSALVSERLWTGGSLIVTDESLSDETSDVGTDLVVTMR